MRVAAKTSTNAFARRFARLQGEIEGAALDAASDALADELAQVRERDGLHAPLMRERNVRRRFVGADDPDSIAREFGNPTEPPAPWLAPSLPRARAPMRAAAIKAAARALSRMRRR